MKESVVGLIGIALILIMVALFFIPDPFAKIYVCFQTVIGFIAFYFLWQSKGWYTHTNTAASLLTLIGVFGTFLGIFIGLQDFEIKDIEASISNLLEGLKLAFLTSLVGIGSAIFLKGAVAPLFQRKDKHPSEVERERFFEVLKSVETSGESNLLTQLKTLTETVEREESETREQSKAAWNAFYILVQEEGSSTHEALDSIKKGQNATLAQLENLTTTVSENVGEIAAKVGQIATGQLIEALKEIIRDFNKNLNEQFGENFKQLNEAVERTVVWQEQYRQQMDELADEFWIAAQSIEQTGRSAGVIAESSSKIAERSNSIVNCVERLDPILHTLNDQLEAFGELRQRALDAFPLIENRLNELTANFSNTVQTAIADSHASMEGQRIALETQTEQLQQVLENTTQQFNQLTTRFSDAVEASIAESHNSMNNQRNELTARFGNLETTMNGVLENTTQQFNQLTTRFSDAVEASIAESHNSMNNQRNELTARFGNLETAMNAALENMTQQLNRMTERFSEVVSNAIDQSHESMNNQRNELTARFGDLETAMAAANQQLQDVINDIGDELHSVFERSADRIAEVTRDFTQDLNRRLTEILQNQSRELSNIVERNREDMENHVNTLNQALREELTKSLTTLAGYLESLSNGFVQNYTEVASSYTQAIVELRQFVDAHNRTS